MRKTRGFALVLAALMALCTLPVSAAETVSSQTAPVSGGWLVEKTQAAPAYTDMDGIWCENAARVCSEAGLLEGYTDGAFRPGSTLTCAQIVAVSARLYDRLAGGDGSIPLVYDDAPWYQGYYAYLAPVLGYDGWESLARPYNPNNGCSRSEFAQMLSAVLEKAGVVLPVLNRVTVIPDACPDWNTGLLYQAGLEKDWYQSVLSLYNAGIMQGVDAYGMLADTTLNRGQAAAMLARAVDPAQRLTFTLASFDLCRDILGLDKDTVVATIGDADITAEQFSYAFAIRFTSGLTMDENGAVSPLAEALPESMNQALHFLKREFCAAQLGTELGWTPTAAESAALEQEAREKAGCGGLSEAAWLYELRQTAALEFAHAHYERVYGATPSPMMHQDGGGEIHFLTELCKRENSTTAALTPTLDGLDWAAVARRIAASPYARREILSRTVLCGYIYI